MQPVGRLEALRAPRPARSPRTARRCPARAARAVPRSGPAAARDHGSAPNSPARRVSPSPGRSPASASASPSRIAYDGVQVRMSGCRSRMSVTCRARHPAGHGHHRRAQLDRALVNAEPAGEQPVAVGVVHQAARVGARRGQRAGAHPGPQLQVSAGYSRPGSGARPVPLEPCSATISERGTPSMPQRIRRPQILLLGHGQPGQILEADVGPRGHAGRAEPLGLHPVQGQQPVHQGAQPFAPAARRAARAASTRRQVRTSSFPPRAHRPAFGRNRREPLQLVIPGIRRRVLLRRVASWIRNV